MDQKGTKIKKMPLKKKTKKTLYNRSVQTHLPISCEILTLDHSRYRTVTPVS